MEVLPVGNVYRGNEARQAQQSWFLFQEPWQTIGACSDDMQGRAEFKRKLLLPKTQTGSSPIERWSSFDGVGRDPVDRTRKVSWSQDIHTREECGFKSASWCCSKNVLSESRQWAWRCWRRSWATSRKTNAEPLRTFPANSQSNKLRNTKNEEIKQWQSLELSCLRG